MAKTKTHAKFVCDENFPATLGKFLKSKGLTIRALPKNMRGKGVPDTRILPYAIKNKKILLTLDRDFLHDEKFTEMIQLSLGIVRFVNPPADPKARQKIVNNFLREFSETEILGKVLEVTQSTCTYIIPGRTS